MCGRFARWSDPDQLYLPFDTLRDPSLPPPSYNVAPGLPVLALAAREGRKVLTAFQWGLVPYWTKDLRAAKGLINARAETLAEKPSFRRAFRSQRCVIPADAFYEWTHGDPARKTPYLFRLANGKPMALAGIYDVWKGTDGTTLATAAIVTTPANGLMAPVHDRMPVILPADRIADWLDNSPDGVILRLPMDDVERRFLAPFPASEMEAYPVSNFVNSPANDSEECVKPLE